MIIESIDPAREEYIRIFEMIHSELEHSPCGSGFGLPCMKHVKFGLSGYCDDSEHYYIPVDHTDPEIWIRRLETRVFGPDGEHVERAIRLKIVWNERKINRTYDFDISQIHPKLADVVRTILTSEKSYGHTYYLLWKYAIPERRERAS